MKRKLLAISLITMLCITSCGTKITKMNGEVINSKQATEMLANAVAKGNFSVTEFDKYLEENFMTKEDCISAKKLIVVKYEENAKNRLLNYTEENDYSCKTDYERYLRNLGFKEDEITYAIEQTNIDFKENAYRNLLYSGGSDKPTISRYYCTLLGFTDEEKEYAYDRYDFKESAYNIVCNYKNQGVTDKQIREILEYELFTEEEILYAFSK